MLESKLQGTDLCSRLETDFLNVFQLLPRTRFHLGVTTSRSMFYVLPGVIIREWNLSISPYLVQMRENVGQNNSEYEHFLRSEWLYSEHKFYLILGRKSVKVSQGKL